MSLNKLRRALIICSCLLLLSAAKPASFKVTGVKGYLLLNVENRLTELYKDKPLVDIPPEALQAQIEKAMYPYGFFKPQITINPRDGGKHVRINIIPGPQMHITSLSIRIIGEGQDNMEIREAIHNLPIHAG